jgi:hypothetical protein
MTLNIRIIKEIKVFCCRQGRKEMIFSISTPQIIKLSTPVYNFLLRVRQLGLVLMPLSAVKK